MTLPRQPLVVALGCLAVALFVFGPRLWVLAKPTPGSFQWDRGLTFLKQVEDPLRRDIEPAMLWRQLPAVVCHYAGLRGRSAFVVPVLGCLCAAIAVAAFARRRNPDPRFVCGTTLLFCSSSACLVPLHWWGINDGWVWLGLLVIAFARKPEAVLAAAALAPWVDERFVLGLPLAVLVRAADRQEPISWRMIAPLAGLLPYLAFRAIAAIQGQGAVAESYLTDRITMAATFAPFAPLGAWMAWRAGWVAAAYGIVRSPFPWKTGLVTAATLSACAFLASDLSRSAAVITPLVVFGAFAWQRAHPESAGRQIAWVAALNLLIPAAHVVHDKIDLINPLVIELVRWSRFTA